MIRTILPVIEVRMTSCPECVFLLPQVESDVRATMCSTLNKSRPKVVVLFTIGSSQKNAVKFLFDNRQSFLSAASLT
jgi:hypothetical protein